VTAPITPHAGPPPGTTPPEAPADTTPAALTAPAAGDAAAADAPIGVSPETERPMPDLGKPQPGTAPETERPIPAPAMNPATDPAVVTELAWRRLSPRMLAVHPVQETLRALPALLVLLVAGSSSGHSGLWSLIGVGVTISLGVLRWATTSYRVSADQVQVRRGFLRRRVLSIPRDRVRTVDLTAHPMHRLLGLARISVGTGQNDRREGLRLDGLTAEEAARLRSELLRRGPAAGEPDVAATVPAGTIPARTVPAETVLAALRARWVWYGPFTLYGLVTIGIVVGFLYRLVNEAHLDPGRFGPLRAVTHHLARIPLGVAVAEVALTAILLVAIASTLGYVLAFWSFRLTRQGGGTLHVSRGLITTRATTIEERRLRGVELSEPLLLRAVRGARCIAIATGLRVGRGAERGGSLLLPPAPRLEARRVAAEVLGDAAPMTVPLIRHGGRARRRRYLRALTLAAIVPAGLALLLLAGAPAWVPLVGLVTLPAGGLLAADRYRSLGHAVTSGHLVVRQGSVVRRRCALARDGIIGWHLRQSVFQRRSGLVTVIATTAAGRQRYPLPDVDVESSVPLVDTATPDLLTPFLVH
jgi:putative membrane protein